MMGSPLLMAGAASVLASSAMAAPASAAAFLIREGPNLWRASKLLGMTVYGPDNRKDGEITDLLSDHDGKAACVVIGVGGFLGLGRKDVALPEGQSRLTDKPMTDGPGSSGSSGRGAGRHDGARAPGSGYGRWHDGAQVRIRHRNRRVRRSAPDRGAGLGPGGGWHRTHPPPAHRPE